MDDDESMFMSYGGCDTCGGCGSTDGGCDCKGEYGEEKSMFGGCDMGSVMNWCKMLICILLLLVFIKIFFAEGFRNPISNYVRGAPGPSRNTKRS
jgi:hypothetical protein